MDDLQRQPSADLTAEARPQNLMPSGHLFDRISHTCDVERTCNPQRALALKGGGSLRNGVEALLNGRKFKSGYHWVVHNHVSHRKSSVVRYCFECPIRDTIDY